MADDYDKSAIIGDFLRKLAAPNAAL